MLNLNEESTFSFRLEMIVCEGTSQNILFFPVQGNRKRLGNLNYILYQYSLKPSEHHDFQQTANSEQVLRHLGQAWLLRLYQYVSLYWRYVLQSANKHGS